MFGHKYELFDKYQGFETFAGREMVYVFACKKCRRKKVITSRKILKVAEKYLQELKEKQFYENFFDTSNTRLVVGHIRGGEIFRIYENYLIEGYVADKTIEYFKTKGIDVSVCHKYVGNSFVIFNGRYIDEF